MDRSQFRKGLWKAAAGLCLCAGLLLAGPEESQAAIRQAEVQTRTIYMVKIEAPEAAVYQKADKGSGKLASVKRGQTFDVLESSGDGWVKIRTGGKEGYLKTSGIATVMEKTSETVDSDARTRRQVVEYALQFVGNPYVYGGTDPNRGADCSGFTRYVLDRAASVELPHSSKGQSACGEDISIDEMQPGDLLFYSGSSGINHVALYIGDGQVVHASTEETGIKTSPYDYRTPVKAVSLIS